MAVRRIVALAVIAAAYLGAVGAPRAQTLGAYPTIPYTQIQNTDFILLNGTRFTLNTYLTMPIMAQWFQANMGLPNFTCAGSTWAKSAAAGVTTCTQPAFSNISGQIATGQLIPPPSTALLGAVKAYSAPSSQWVKGVDTTGSWSASQPAASDLSNGVSGSGAVVLASGASQTGQTIASSTVLSSTLSGNTISGGSINNAPIGQSTPAAGAFTTLSATTPLPVASGGNGTSTPSLTAGAGISLSGSWPSYTVSATAAGGWVLLNTLTASSSASLQDTTSITNSYTQYLFVLENVVPATAAATCQMQLQISAAFQTTGYSAFAFQITNGGSSGSGNISTYIPCDTSSGTNNVDPGFTTYIEAGNLSNASNRHQFVTKSVSNSNSQVISIGFGGGWYNTAAGAVTGVKFLMSSGNITSGVVKIYGRP